MNLSALLDAPEGVGVENAHRLREHQQDQLSYMRTAPGLRAGHRRPPLPVHRHERVRPRRHPPTGAVEYVCRQTRIESIVFAASSRGNIESTQRLIQQLDAKFVRQTLITSA
jgi:hypothetical protein